MADQAQSITLDGISYAIDQFSPQVQQAVAIYNTFQADLAREQLAVIKTQSAVQSISGQIAEAVKKELAEKAAKAAGEAVEAPAAE